RTVAAVLAIVEADALLDRHPVLQRSLRLRNPDVDPMNAIQVELLRRFRDPAAGEAGREAVRLPLRRSLWGTAAALRNTGRRPRVTHEYRGRIFESRVLPKALVVFVVQDERAEAVVEAIVDAARSGNESGDGIVWTSPVANVTHNRTGLRLEEVEVGA